MNESQVRWKCTKLIACCIAVVINTIVYRRLYPWVYRVFHTALCHSQLFISKQRNLWQVGEMINHKVLVKGHDKM